MRVGKSNWEQKKNLKDCALKDCAKNKNIIEPIASVVMR